MNTNKKNRLTSEEDFIQWESASQDTIDVKRCYIDLARQDLVAGVLLSQIIYWHLSDSQGRTRLRVEYGDRLWLAKRREDWWEECRIKPRTFDRKRELLEEEQLITTATYKFKGSPTLHIALNWPFFLKKLAAVVGNDTTPESSAFSGVTPERSPKQSYPSRQNGDIHVAEMSTSIYSKKTAANTTEINIALPALTQFHPILEAPITSGDLESIFRAYPRQISRATAVKSIRKALDRIIAGEDEPDEKEEKWPPEDPVLWLRHKTAQFAQSSAGNQGEFTPGPINWFNGSRYCESVKEWNRSKQAKFGLSPISDFGTESRALNVGQRKGEVNSDEDLNDPDAEIKDDY